MADTQSILQLGIEAARAGNKTEARELFRLVTREDPNNSQGWLWLAGVAEDREEKRVALERVVQLEPSNQLAQKGLAALGGPRAAATPPVSDPRDTGMTAPLPIESRPNTSHTQFTPPNGPATDQDIADAFDSIGTYAAAPESGRARTYDQPEQVGGYVPPDFGDDDYDLSEYQNRPRVTVDDIAAQERATTVVVEDEEPRNRGMMAWIPLALILLLLCIGSAYVYREFFGNNARGPLTNRPGATTGTSTAGTNGAEPGNVPPLSGTTVAGEQPGGSPAVPGGEQPGGSPAVPGGEQPGGSPAVPGGEQPGASPAAPAPGGEQPGASPAAPAPGGEQPGASPAAPAPGGEQPGASPAAPAPGGEQPGASPAAPAPGGEQPGASPAAPASDVASANPAIVPNAQSLRAGDFEYNYSFGLRNFATGSYGGAPAARGRYLIVLVSVRNVGGQPQQIPDGFFVVKDAQGRVSDFNRAASVDYINRFGGTGPGGAGDYAANTQLQPNAPFGSMPLLFDVAGDATNFVLFSRDNTSQGFGVR